MTLIVAFRNFSSNAPKKGARSRLINTGETVNRNIRVLYIYIYVCVCVYIYIIYIYIYKLRKSDLLVLQIMDTYW